MHGLTREVAINLTYLRDSLTNIRIRVLSPGHPSLGRMPHTPTIFLGAEYISPCFALPPLAYTCMCAVNAGGCVIDLFVQGWASTSSLLCSVTGNNANTDNSPVSTSPFWIPPYQAWRVAGRRWKITSDTFTLFQWTAPTGNRTRVTSVIAQSVTKVYANYFYDTSVICSNSIIAYREPFTICIGHDRRTDVIGIDWLPLDHPRRVDCIIQPLDQAGAIRPVDYPRGCIW